MRVRDYLRPVVAFALVPALCAHTIAPQAPVNSRDYTFKVNSELVLVNLVVRDKQGNLVRGLKREDFTVYEDGKQQNISSFDFENTEAGPEVATTGPAQQTVDTGVSAPAAAEASKKEASPFSNRRLIVLFFDFTGMETEDIDRSVASAQKYVDQQMSPADTVAVVTFSSSLQVVQEFTPDRALLKKALLRLTGASGEGYAAGSTGGTEGTADTGGSFTADDSDFNTFNTDRKLQALQSLTARLAGIEQKKSIIYFSNGVSRNGLENQSQLRATVDTAVKANVAIYTMDIRGLQALPPNGEAQGASLRGVSAYSGAAVRGQLDSNFASQETLVTLAGDTGGKAFLDSNDFSKIFKKVQDDTAAYYVIGYRSGNKNKDGRFRKITVKTAHPDVKLEYRAGYYAPKDFAHANRDDREEEMQKELASELPATDVSVYLSAAYFRMNDGQYYVPVSLIVPGSEIPFTSAANKDKATLDIIGMVRESQSHMPVANARETVKLAIDENQQVKHKNVQYNTGFVLAPGTYHVKFVIRENQNGKIGSFETDITLPDLKHNQQKNTLKMSSVVIGGQVKDAGKAPKNNPLIRDGKELVPNITHVFSADQHMYMYYEVYDPAKPAKAVAVAPSPAAPAPPAAGATAAKTPAEEKRPNIRVMSSVEFFNGKVKAFETPMVEVHDLTAADRKAAAFQLDVPLSQLRPGYYTCQVNVVDDAAGTFLFPRFALLVKPAVAAGAGGGAAAPTTTR
jgi:VWFA-related protein